MQSQHSHWFERARRRSAPAVVVAALLLCGFVAVPHSSADSQTAAQIADQIVALQARADSVAAEWARHDTEATQFTIDIAAAQQSVDAAGATSAAMEAALGKVAVDRYTGAMQPEIIPFSADVMPRVEMAALSELAFNSGLINLDGLRLAHADLSRKKRSLDQLKSKNDAALAALERSRETLDKQLADLATLQAKLNDAEVKSAYEAKVAALRKQQAADAAATVTTLHTPVVPARGGGVTQPTPSPTTPAASPPQPPTPDTRPTKDAPSSSTPITPPSITPPSITPPSITPPVPAATPAPQRPSVNGLICPVAGPNAFGDSWGAARSGGRRHEGVDMMSPFGTPLVAVISGFATMKMNSLGGITVGLKGADGNYYYYAHLSRWEGSSRAVSQGDVVGYVGHTGDTTANHLHFGIYFRGGAAINPYPVVRPIC